VAVNVAEVPQFVNGAAVEFVMVTPGGSSSLTLRFVRSVSLGAVIMILNLESVPAEMEDGENAFVPARLVPLIFTLAVAADRGPTP